MNRLRRAAFGGAPNEKGGSAPNDTARSPFYFYFYFYFYFA